MKLPAEIRIQIYEYALVRDVIRVVSTLHPFGAIRPKFFQNIEEWYEEPNPEKAITLRSRRTQLVNVKYIRGEIVGDEVSYSYRMQPNSNSPGVNLFLTSRQIYSEAWPIFYEKNAFAFTIPPRHFHSGVNCLDFLYDRPYHALQHIRELHLLIGRCPSNSLRFDICCYPLNLLWDEVNRYLSLRVLVLYIRGRTDDALGYNARKLPWKEEIMKISGLQELHLDIITSSTNEESTVFVTLLRSKMVIGGEQMGTEDLIFGLRQFAPDGNRWWNSVKTTTRYSDMEEHYLAGACG